MKKKSDRINKRVTSISKPPTDRIQSTLKQKNWKLAMDAFLFWKKAQGVRQATLTGYANHIRHFFNRFDYIWANDEELKEAVMTHMADDIKPATYNLRLIYLRVFFQWSLDEGYVVINPLDGYKKRKAEARIVDIPMERLQQLLSLPDLNTFAGLRDYALILFTLDIGIRPGEAFQLTIQMFDLSHYSVMIPASISKTRQTHTLPISHQTIEIIKKLIRVRPDDWGESVPVFCNHEGNPLTRHTWNDRLERYSKHLNFKIRPYDLRHVFAIMYLRNGGNAFSLQRMMGHGNMDMTKRYLHITGQDLRDVHQQSSPIHSLVPSKKSRMRKL